MGLARLRLGQADLRQFRIGIGDMRDMRGLGLGGQAQHGRADDDAGVVAGHMGELQPPRHVADGRGAAVGGPEAAVGLDAPLGGLDPGLVEGEPVDIGFAPHGDQQVGAGKATPVLGRHLDGAGRAADLRCLRALGNLDAFRAQPVEHDGRQLRVVLPQRLRALDHRDLAAQPYMRLRHLHPDRPAADDQQVIGPLAPVEEGFVGVIRHAVEPRDGRDKRRRAGGDHDPAGPDDGVAGLHFPGRDELAVFPDHRDAELFEPLLAVMRLDRGNGLRHMLHRGGVIDLRRDIGHTERRGMGLAVRRLGAGDQRLRRDTAEIQAVAPHPVPFQQHDRGAHLHRARGHRQPAGARADDKEVGGQALGFRHSCGLSGA